MNNFLEYIDKSFENMKETESLYRYKQKLIAEMTERANELVAAGLKDDKIICAIIMEENPDLVGRYKAAVKRKSEMSKKSRTGSLIAVGAMGGIFAFVCLYLAVSFLTGAWSKTWMILLGGIFAVLVFVFIVLSGKLTKKAGKFGVLPRILCAASVFLIATYLFLFTTIIVPLPGSWIAFVLAVPFAMIFNMLLSFKFNKKTGIFSVVLYIPVIFTLTYIFLGIAGVLPWHPGWLLILLGVLADFVLVGVKLLSGTRVKEEEDEWSED